MAVSICTAASSGALLVAPGRDDVHIRAESGAELVADRVAVDARLELDGDGVDHGDARGRVDHAPQLLQLADRHEDEDGVVLAHLALVEIDDGEVVADGLGRGAGGGKGQLDVVARQHQKMVLALGVAVTGHGDAQDHAGVLFLGRVENISSLLLMRGERIGRGVPSAGRPVLLRRGARSNAWNCGHRAAVRPAGVAHLLPLRRSVPAVVVADVVAALAEFEKIGRGRPAVLRVLQVLAEVAHAALRRLVNADQLHLPRDPGAAVRKLSMAGTTTVAVIPSI